MLPSDHSNNMVLTGTAPDKHAVPWLLVGTGDQRVVQSTRCTTSYNELWKSFRKTDEIDGEKDPLPLFSGAGQKLVLQALSTGGF